MAKRRRGPPPNPNSAFRRALGKRARINFVVDQLDRSIGLLPPLFLKADIEAKVSADVTDPDTRSAVTFAFLRRRGAVPLGSHTRDHRFYNLWAREDSERIRSMTRGQRLQAVLGNPPPPPPPAQNIPSSLSDWREEYRAVHSIMAEHGFAGRPHQIWREPFARKLRTTADLVNKKE